MRRSRRGARLHLGSALIDLPTSYTATAFDGFLWPAVTTNRCNGVIRGLELWVTYNVWTTVRADVRDDGCGPISATTGTNQVRTTL